MLSNFFGIFLLFVYKQFGMEDNFQNIYEETPEMDCPCSLQITMGHV